VNTQQLTRGTLALVLAGGQGERLYPLTRDRSKPAVPFGSAYRIIDFTLSNCLNSGLRMICVLIQYKSDSLERHLQLGCDSPFSPELREWIHAVPLPRRSRRSHPRCRDDRATPWRSGCSAPSSTP